MKTAIFYGSTYGNTQEAGEQLSALLGKALGAKPEVFDIYSTKSERLLEFDLILIGCSTWNDGELWHATWEGDESELRHVDPDTGEVLQKLAMPPGVLVSGLEADVDRFYCGVGSSGKVRAVRRPRRR